MSAVLRVAHIMPFPGVGGTEQGQLRLAQAVRSSGVESAAYCLDDAPAVQRFFKDARLDVVVWHRRDVADSGRGSFAYRTLHLARELRRRNTDIVHCSDAYAVSRQVTVAARLAGAAIVCHVRNRNERVAAAVSIGGRARPPASQPRPLTSGGVRRAAGSDERRGQTSGGVRPHFSS